MITVVTSVTRPDIYEKCLGRSLKEEKTEYKLIKTNPELPCSTSYNTVKEVDTEYVAFIHQDLVFLEKGYFLKKAEDFANQVDDLGVGGFAGWKMTGGFVGYFPRYLPARKKRSMEKLITFKGDLLRGEIYGKPFFKPIPVQVVDDMFYIIKGSMWNKEKFDSDNFTFHCLGWDYCLSMEFKYNLRNYVFPLNVYEYSITSFTGEYRRKHGIINEAKKVLRRKWNKNIKQLRGWKL